MTQDLVASLSPPPVPDRPPQRVYVSGYTYKLVTPTIHRPPLPLSVKTIANWANGLGRVAKNIWYLIFPPGADTTNPTFLQHIADSLMTQWATSTLNTGLNSNWSLNSMTVKDNSGGSSSQATSTHAPISGGGSGTCMPPNCAVCISWNIPATYRGGKPRWYLPGVGSSMVGSAGDSAITGAVALALETAANALRTSINATAIDTFVPQLGTISYQSGHAARPTPLFRPFQLAKVHERVDSQRRRSGKESTFPVVP